MKKLLLLFSLLLLTASLAFSQGVVVAPQTAFKVVNGLTTPIANATVTVCAALTGGIPCSPALANSIFKNAALTQPLSNPFTADSTGNYQFAIAPGNYTVTVTSLGFTGQSYQLTVATPISLAGGLGDPGANGVVFRNGLNTTRPAASADVISLWSGTCNVGTVLRGDGSCATSSSAFSAITSGANTTAAMQNSTGSSLSPLNLGQVSGSQLWMTPAMVVPGMTAGATSSGTLSAGHGIVVEVTYNTAAGETLPSIYTQIATNAAGCASNCSVTVTAPTLASGFTGYSVYSCEINSGTYPATPCSSPATLVKLASCTNITGNCVITATPSGSTQPPTTITAWIQPPNVQPTECPPDVVPSMFSPDASGNYHTWAGMLFDSNQVVPRTTGTPVFCHSTFFTDMKANPVSGNNAFVVIAHQTGVNTDQVNNQDRSLWVTEANLASDTSQHYSFTGVQTEVDVNNAPTWTGAIDSEVAAFSGQISDNVTNTLGPSSTGVYRASWFRAATATGNINSSGVVAGYKMDFTNNSTTSFPAGTQWNGFQYQSASGTNTNLTQSGLKVIMRGPRNGTANIGYLAAQTSWTPAAGISDWLVRNDVNGWNSNLNGIVGLTGIVQVNPASLPINASVNVIGAESVSQIASGWTAPTGSCSGGASTYAYTLVAVDVNGGQSVSAQSGNFTNCTNPLTSGNPATINGPALSTFFGGAFNSAVRVDVYRVAGPMALGKVGSFTCNNNLPITGGCSSFVDTGLTASGTLPTTNTTGGMTAAGYLHSSLNTVQLASDFTSAANTSLQTIGVLTWNLDASAKKYSFHCSLMYSQATAAVAMQFGIQAATVNPNDISAKGRVDTQTAAASAQTTGILSNLATTTATSIVTFTPSATATVFGADLDGSIDNPANNQGQVVNIMVQTSNSADLPTVKRGSYCTLY